jgi:hypothetical protein
MKCEERETVKIWVDTWKRAGVALAEIKRQELTSVEYGRDQALIDEMLLWAHEHRTERLTSGLVDQQRIFKKIAEKLR